MFSVIGGEGRLRLIGGWDADTNTPDLSAIAAEEGHAYQVTVAGDTNLDGETDWEVGDWAVKTATVWIKQDNSQAGEEELLELLNRLN